MTQLTGVNVPPAIADCLKSLESNYTLERQSVKGGNGYLFFGKHNIIHRDVAIKFYYWGGDKKYHAEPRQIADILAENIIQIFDAAAVDEDWAYFVTPHCGNGDLDEAREKCSPSIHEAIDWVSGILTGLCQLHSRRFVHRDLKPANIFLTDERKPVIGDLAR